MDEKFTLRPATEADVPLLAMVVAEALDDDIMEQYERAGGEIPAERRERMALIEQVVSNPHTLYTWHHATISCAPDGTPAGALVAYSGDDYATRRGVTFRLFTGALSFDPEQMDAETVPGEYYLDSLAVMPSFRGRGVARMLLQSGIKKARALGRPAILACAPDNHGAKRLYESLGFKETYIYSLFGHPYHRMIVE
ncbi:MAG: GNAT family N-acetyltransferase [Bacteroidales bacterium]|nr:GNAT family N-acetyltransferase [Bacteroidales bacterium]